MFKISKIVVFFVLAFVLGLSIYRFSSKAKNKKRFIDWEEPTFSYATDHPFLHDIFGDLIWKRVPRVNGKLSNTTLANVEDMDEWNEERNNDIDIV